MEKWICSLCGASFERYKSQVKNPHQTFCSQKCKGLWQSTHLTGSQNPNFKSGFYANPSYCVCGQEKDRRATLCATCANKSFDKGTKNNHVELQSLITAVNDSKSFLQVAEKLNLTRATATKYVAKFGINIDHFRPGRGRPIPTEKLFTAGTTARYAILKSRLLSENLLQYVCVCGQGDTWNGKQLVLQLDHVNGDPTDNRLENLRFLCPNCHTQTETFCGKNMEKSNARR